MASKKLGPEETEILKEFFVSMYWQPVRKLLEAEIEALEKRMVQFNLDAGDRALSLELAKLHGARTLLKTLLALSARK